MPENLVDFLEAERFKRLGSRMTFPITSLFQIVEARWGQEALYPEEDQYLDQIALRNIVLPYLLYGEVVVQDLNKFKKDETLASIKLLSYAQDRQLCIDLDAYYPSFETTPILHPEQYIDFNDQFAQVDALKCTLMAELIRRRRRLNLSPIYQARVKAAAEISGLANASDSQDFDSYLQAVSGALGVRKYDTVPSKAISWVAALKDSDLATMCGNVTRMAASFDVQSLSFRMRGLGVTAIPVHLDGADNLFVKHESNLALRAQQTVIELLFRGIAMPNIPNRLELLDFVSQQEYRQSISGLRRYISTVASGTLDDVSICEALRDDLQKLDDMTQKQKVGSVFCVLKVFLSGLPGAAAEIMKLNISGAADKLIDVAEQIIGFKETRDAIKEEPLFMLWKLSHSQSAA